LLTHGRVSPWGPVRYTGAPGHFELRFVAFVQVQVTAVFGVAQDFTRFS
jgi:hypothetical protein